MPLWFIEIGHCAGIILVLALRPHEIAPSLQCILCLEIGRRTFAGRLKCGLEPI
jgi:hypothetical protein